MRKGIPVDKMLEAKTNNISKLEDFRIKTLMSYWRKGKGFECLCGEKDDPSPFHILNECEKVKEWEERVNSIGKTNNFFFV